MKTRLLFITLIAFLLGSCRFEHKVIEESYPDGSPKRVCVYKGKGENRELIHETTYYSNKQTQMDGGYENNKRTGKWIYWYENGKLWSEGNFRNGKSEGRRTTYFDNGKVRIDGFYKEDIRVGKWKFFDENGRLLREMDFSAPPKEIKK